MTQIKVLVAEDESALRNNIVWLLRAEGFEPLAADNGSEAMALARQHLPDLIISDVMMPRMDGHQFLAALRADPLTASIPLIFLTARADFKDMRTGMNLGADDYLVKPFQRDDLLGAVRARLLLKQKQQGSSQRLQQTAKRLLHFDPLTNLSNRAFLLERLLSAINHSRRYQTSLALMVLNLDDFSGINHSLGRSLGDQVLQQVANRLFSKVNGAPYVCEYDTVARLGGDQFAVLLVGFEDAAFLEDYVQDLLLELAKPYQLNGQELFLTACAGIAMFNEQTDSAETLLEQAEVAVPQAKQAGHGSQRYFSAEMNALASRRLRLHNELHLALERGQLHLHYQPQARVTGGHLIGYEALLRWEHPELGAISPVEFIPVAEQNGLIVPIGQWVLTNACRQAKAWLDAGLGPLRMAVNLSVRQFDSGDLTDTVALVLAETGLPASSLELEITESIAMQSVERTLSILHALKRLGVALAMDDFGTGYSSLAYLKRYPLDTLKVDQSFVRNITTDHGDASITRAIVAMAHSFGMSVIAEGVESQAHLDYLAKLGCEEFQGYHLSKPVPALAAQDLLSRQRQGAGR